MKKELKRFIWQDEIPVNESIVNIWRYTQHTWRIDNFLVLERRWRKETLNKEAVEWYNQKQHKERNGSREKWNKDENENDNDDDNAGEGKVKTVRKNKIIIDQKDANDIKASNLCIKVESRIGKRYVESKRKWKKKK